MTECIISKAPIIIFNKKRGSAIHDSTAPQKSILIITWMPADQAILQVRPAILLHARF
jgi:hypothetical protein